MPLAMIRCHTHGRFHTLYPPGYVPYSRQPLLHVDALGNAIPPDSPGEELFKGTLLELPGPGAEPARARDVDNEAAAAARRSRARAGQRRVGFLGRLFGLEGATVRVQEQLAALLHIPLVLLTLAARTYAGARFATRREQVRGVLDALVLGPGLLWRLMEAGYRTGFFGRAWIAGNCLGGPPGCAILPFPGPE